MNYCHTAADQSYPWAAFSFLRILLLSRSPQAVAQTASHVGTVTGPASGSTRLASAPFGLVQLRPAWRRADARRLIRRPMVPAPFAPRGRNRAAPQAKENDHD